MNGARLAALFVAIALASCGEEPSEIARACGRASEADVRATFATWTQAYAQRDLAGVMSIFSPEVQFEFEGQPKQNYTQLESGFREEFARNTDAQWVGEPERVMVTGDSANVVSTWRLQSNGETRETNRAVDALERGEDCTWRIVRSMNYRVQQPQ